MNSVLDVSGLEVVGHSIGKDGKRPIFAIADADLEKKGSFHGIQAVKDLFLHHLRTSKRRPGKSGGWEMVNLPTWLLKAQEALSPYLDNPGGEMIRLVEVIPLGATFETPRHYFPIELLEATQGVFNLLRNVAPVKRKTAAAITACSELLGDLGSDEGDVTPKLAAIKRSAQKIVDEAGDGGPGQRHALAALCLVKSLEASIREKLGDDLGEDDMIIADTLSALLEAHSFVAHDEVEGAVLRRLAAKRYAAELASWIHASDRQTIYV